MTRYDDNQSWVPDSNKPSRYPATLPSLLSVENLNRKAQPSPINWAVGWADLMMTMFVLFLVMYLYQPSPLQAIHHEQKSPWGKTAPSAQGDQTARQVAKIGNGGGIEMTLQPTDAQKPGIAATDSQSNPVERETTRLYDLVVLTLKNEDLAKFAEIQLSPDQTVRIILAADLLFPSGKADLRLTAREKITKIAFLLKQTPHRINVVGHTDDVPIKAGPYASNWELSVMRATTVARYLIEEMGLPASQFSVTGQSFHQPQVDNLSEENRAKNRRVEIIVSREKPPEKAPNLSMETNQGIL